MPIQLEIVTPKGVTFSEPVRSCTVPGIDGDFAVHDGHAPLISALRVGVVELENAAGEWKYVAIVDGFVEVTNDRVALLASIAEMGDEIDTARAQEAKTRAEKRLKSAEPGTDAARAQRSLERAANRLYVAGGKQTPGQADDKKKHGH